MPDASYIEVISRRLPLLIAVAKYNLHLHSYCSMQAPYPIRKRLQIVLGSEVLYPSLHRLLARAQYTIEHKPYIDLRELQPRVSGPIKSYWQQAGIALPTSLRPHASYELNFRAEFLANARDCKVQRPTRTNFIFTAFCRDVCMRMDREG